jgi:predicted component of type VI protein secretion system
LKSLIARLGTRFGERQAEDDVSHPDCPLCSHPARDDIERLLNTKRKEETWKRHLTILRQTYGMPHLTPRQIVGHRQYHRATGKIGVDPGANSAANIA